MSKCPFLLKERQSPQGEVAAPVGSKVTGTVNGAKRSNCVELDVAAKKVKDALSKTAGVESLVANCALCLTDNFQPRFRPRLSVT